MEQQVIQILEQAFQGMSIELDEMPSGRFSGSVVWDGFSEHDQADRQRQVRQVLKAALGEEVQQVGVLLTYTPSELSAMQGA